MWEIHYQITNIALLNESLLLRWLLYIVILHLKDLEKPKT